MAKSKYDYGTLSAGAGADDALQPGEVSLREKGVMIVALFLKGGLLGAWIPFISLWLHAKDYSASGIAALNVVDVVSSILLVPVLGS